MYISLFHARDVLWLSKDGKTLAFERFPVQTLEL